MMLSQKHEDDNRRLKISHMVKYQIGLSHICDRIRRKGRVNRAFRVFYAAKLSIWEARMRNKMYTHIKGIFMTLPNIHMRRGFLALIEYQQIENMNRRLERRLLTAPTSVNAVIRSFLPAERAPILRRQNSSNRT